MERIGKKLINNNIRERIFMKVSNYKELNHGCLQGCFDVDIEEVGITIRECKFFEKECRKWIGMPSRQYQAKDGTTKHTDCVILEKSKQQAFEKAVLEKLLPMRTVCEELPF